MRSIQSRVDLPTPFSKQRISAHGGLERTRASWRDAINPRASCAPLAGRKKSVERREGALRRRAGSPEAYLDSSRNVLQGFELDPFRARVRLQSYLRPLIVEP
jgi:hypothetical protein